MDWLKIIKDLTQREEAKKAPIAKEQETRAAQQQEADQSWPDRIMKKIQEASRQGFFIHVKRRPNHLELYVKGKVEIEYRGPQSYSVTYRNVLKPSKLILNRPIMVYHHRLVRLRELDDHNMEEILKFVILGMDKYCEAAKFTRIERNLLHVMEIGNVDERV